MKSRVLDALVDGAFHSQRTIWFHTHDGDAEDVPQWHEIKLAVLFMLFFSFLRGYLFGKLMVERMGDYLGVMVDSIALKLVNQAISFWMHMVSTVWAVWWLPEEPWFQAMLHGHPEAIWEDLFKNGHIQMTMSFKVFYMIHLGYQLHALRATIQEGRAFTHDRRADYAQMMVHHVVAVLIMIISYVMGFGRMGSLVMVLHNVSDIAVCICKIAKLLGLDRLVLYLFPVMILCWFVTRLVMYPYYVLWNTYQVPFTKAPTVLMMVAFVVCEAGLFIFLALNLYWFGKFLHMAWNIIFHGNSIDLTESNLTNEVVDKYGLWNKNRWWEVGASINAASDECS
eukprot:TRINITY_DN4426_c0_g3_i1.p1 TRINITY_DN4426_c0_g3~~TRINITY_DN4426_c0_g3_i1.p1  ORF type:complete len:339 (+),score=134.99 TRINITY_DN4426_c0_g3_i1:142-1158(+)